jgi:hypothetical protein
MLLYSAESRIFLNLLIDGDHGEGEEGGGGGVDHEIRDGNVVAELAVGLCLRAPNYITSSRVLLRPCRFQLCSG